MKRICLFLFAFAMLLADEESASLSNIHAISSGIVGGHVNVVTGDFIDHAVDMVIGGPEPLVISRSYCSSKAIKRAFCNEGWSWGHISSIFKYKQDHKDCVSFWGGSAGAVLATNFKNKNDKGKEYSLNEFNGFTNAGSSFLSGKTNAKNTTIYLEKDRVYVTEGSGDKFTFNEQEIKSVTTGVLKTKSHYLKEHKRASGIRYDYKFVMNTDVDAVRHRFPFDRIDQKTLDGKIVSSVWVDGFWTDGQLPRLRLKGSNGQEVSYLYHLHRAFTPYYHLVKVLSTRKPEIQYGYLLPTGQFCDRITSKRVGDHNLSIDYFLDEDLVSPPIEKQIKTKTNDKGDTIYEITYYYPLICTHKLNRVKALRTNHNDAILYEFDYPNLHQTVVVDGNKHKKIYYSDDQFRLKEIDHLSNGGPIVKENFQYSDDGNLIKKSIKNGQDRTLYNVKYSYDKQNNVTQETITGDLVGNGENQNYIVHHENYLDFANNPKLTWEDNGRSTLKTYLPNSSLIKASYYKEHGQIKKREFRNYHPDTTVLISVTEDDGSSLNENDLTGVTERKMATFTTRSEFPVGLPEVIQYHVYNPESNVKVLVNRIERKYLKTGEVVEERNFDANGELKHVQIWEYDAHGNMTRHIDPLGREVVKRYDNIDRLIFSQGPRTDIHFEYVYDLQNRPITQREVHQNGEVYEKNYKYDVMGNKISQTDEFGNTTEYQYDDLDRVVKTICPPIETGERPSLSVEYNELGFPIKTIDSLGNETKTRFNIRGKPSRIEHPDGTLETFVYSVEGNLLKGTAINGVSTLYTYDLQGRVLSQEEIAPSGRSLGVIQHEYNTFHRLKTIDKDGMVTTYSYDCFGRLKEEQCGERFKRYTYDASGRISESTDGTVINRFKYDEVDRVIEETVHDLLGNLQSIVRYGYDLSGNKNRTYSYINGESLSYSVYNAKGLPITIVDVEGLESHLSYNFKAKNNQNQTVLEVTATDPKGNSLVTQNNTRGKPALICRYNPYGILLAKQENFYDIQGRRFKTIHYAVAGGVVLKEITHLVEYDKMGRVIAVTQAAGTPEQKRDRQIYNQLGQKTEVIKNDGVSLLMSYDEEGILLNHKASDASFEYNYQYNLNRQPSVITDVKNQQTHSLKYNDYKELEEENLQNGLTVKYKIDSFGRIEQLILPDSSTVDYTFKGKRLDTIKRKDLVHKYELYNLGGTPTYSILASGAALNTYCDTKGRILSLTAPGLKEDEFVYDRCGNLTQHILQGELRQYSYDDLNQLNTDPYHSYSHDSLNNRLTKDNDTYTHNSLNQLLSQGEVTYKYDLNGNRIEKSTPTSLTTYKYDALDRMIQINVDGTITNYTYDSFNRRLSKNSVLYLYQGQNEIGSLLDNAFIDLRILGNGHGAEIGAAVLLEIQETPYIPLHDHCGNVISLLNLQNETVATYSYTPFGEALITSSHPNQWRFASKRFDEESGFICFGRRYYDPSIGKWLTPDPIGFEDGPNLYSYLHNSPLLSVDLYGLEDSSSYWDSFCNTVSSICSSVRDFCSSTYDRISDGVCRAGRAMREGLCGGGRFARDLVRFTGHHGNNLVHHTVPHIPILKDALKMPFHLMENGTFKNYTPTYRETHSQWYECGDPSKGICNVIVPGILNTKEELCEKMQLACIAFGGKQVYGFYDASHGADADFSQCTMEYVNIPTNASNLLQKGLEGLSKSVGDLGKVILAAFSRGCGTSENAIRGAIKNGCNPDSFYALYLAPPKLPGISTEYSFKGTISNRDGVTLGSRISNFFNPDSRVSIEQGHGMFPLDHRFDNRVYSESYYDNFIKYTQRLMESR